MKEASLFWEPRALLSPKSCGVPVLYRPLHLVSGSFRFFTARGGFSRAGIRGRTMPAGAIPGSRQTGRTDRRPRGACGSRHVSRREQLKYSSTVMWASGLKWLQDFSTQTASLATRVSKHLQHVPARRRSNEGTDPGDTFPPPPRREAFFLSEMEPLLRFPSWQSGPTCGVLSSLEGLFLSESVCSPWRVKSSEVFLQRERRSGHGQNYRRRNRSEGK